MSKSQLHTPVALLIFNRPDTTRRVFEAIRQARPTRLLVVADGPRADRPDDVIFCKSVRAIVEGVDWDCKVMKCYTDTNMGCGRRISSGLNWVFDQVEEAIILEDDCVPHPDFFPYCEALLTRYRDDVRLMMISGTNCLQQEETSDSYFFSQYFNVWGWATWRRAWQKYNPDLEGWEEARGEQFDSLYTHKAAARYFTKVFDAVRRKEIDTWDYQWTYSCITNHGLSIVPRVNLISNIGFAGTHTGSAPHSHPLFNMPTHPLDTRNLKHPKLVKPNESYDRAFFDRYLRKSLASKIRKRVLSLWNR